MMIELFKWVWKARVWWLSGEWVGHALDNVFLMLVSEVGVGPSGTKGTQERDITAQGRILAEEEPHHSALRKGGGPWGGEKPSGTAARPPPVTGHSTNGQLSAL